MIKSDDCLICGRSSLFLCLIIIGVTRTCHTRHTNVLHALHERITLVTRTCHANFAVEFTTEIQYI